MCWESDRYARFQRADFRKARRKRAYQKKESGVANGYAARFVKSRTARPPEEPAARQLR